MIFNFNITFVDELQNFVFRFKWPIPIANGTSKDSSEVMIPRDDMFSFSIRMKMRRDKA